MLPLHRHRHLTAIDIRLQLVTNVRLGNENKTERSVEEKGTNVVPEYEASEKGGKQASRQKCGRKWQSGEVKFTLKIATAKQA